MSVKETQYIYIYTSEEEEEKMSLCNVRICLFKAHLIYSSASTHAWTWTFIILRSCCKEYTYSFSKVSRLLYSGSSRKKKKHRKQVLGGEKSISMRWFLNNMCEYTRHIRTEIKTNHLHKCQRQITPFILIFLF
jgi:hypothetical protein